MYQLITRLAGDVAPDELAVHADAFAGNLQSLDLLSGDLLEHLLHQVDTRFLLVSVDAAAEQVPRVNGRGCIADVLQSKCPAGQHVKVAFLEQLRIAAAEPLLQGRHADQHTNGRVRATAFLAFGEKGLERTLVYFGGYKAVELILPSLRVGVLLRGTVAKLHHGRCKHIELGIPFGLLEHIGQVVDSPYKGTKFIPHISIDRHIYIVIIVNRSEVYFLKWTQ